MCVPQFDSLVEGSLNDGAGLKKSLKEGEEIPALFTDPLVNRSSYWVLSTSAIFSKHFQVYGWGEVRSRFFKILYLFRSNEHAGRPRRLWSGLYDWVRWCVHDLESVLTVYPLHSHQTACSSPSRRGKNFPTSSSAKKSPEQLSIYMTCILGVPRELSYRHLRHHWTFAV